MVFNFTDTEEQRPSARVRWTLIALRGLFFLMSSAAAIEIAAFVHDYWRARNG